MHQVSHWIYTYANDVVEQCVTGISTKCLCFLAPRYEIELVGLNYYALFMYKLSVTTSVVELFSDCLYLG